MKLLIDAGNTRIKWALAKNQQMRHQGILMHEEVAQLQNLTQWGSIEMAWGALVGGEPLGQAIEQYSPAPVQWVKSQKNGYGLRNHAGGPHDTLGVDIWLGLIGLKDQVPNNVVLASLGTALTVGALTKEGDYLGGIIAPGMTMMLNSLLSGTALIRCPMGQWADFPINTPDAVASGILDSLAGAIERFRNRFATYCHTPTLEVILTGGDAKRLVPFVASPCRVMNNLVLDGLLRVANAP